MGFGVIDEHLGFSTSEFWRQIVTAIVQKKVMAIITLN
jgi:hypothetical protein